MLVLRYIMKSATSWFMYPCSYGILMLGAVCKITPSSFDFGRGGALLVKALQVSEWIGFIGVIFEGYFDSKNSCQKMKLTSNGI